MSCFPIARKGTFKLVDGFSIAFQQWGVEGAKRVLALHGWLDNSNTHSILGPYLANHGYHVVAMDFVGHGFSSHLPNGVSYGFPK